MKFHIHFKFRASSPLDNFTVSASGQSISSSDSTIFKRRSGGSKSPPGASVEITLAQNAASSSVDVNGELVSAETPVSNIESPPPLVETQISTSPPVISEPSNHLSFLEAKLDNLRCVQSSQLYFIELRCRHLIEQINTLQGRCNQALIDFHKKTLFYHIIRGEIEEKYALAACNAVFGRTDPSGRRRSSRPTRKPQKYQDEPPASPLTSPAAATNPVAEQPTHKQPNNRLASAAKLVKRSLETLGSKGKRTSASAASAPKRKLASSPKPTVVLKKAKRDAKSSNSKRRHQSGASSKHHQKHHHRSRRSSSSSSTSSLTSSSSSSSCSTCASSRSSSSPEITAVETAPRKLNQPKKATAHMALKRFAKARSPHPKPKPSSLKPASLILPPSKVIGPDARNSPKLPPPPEQAAALARERASSSSNGSVFASSVASSFKTLYKPSFNVPSASLSKSGHLYQQLGSISIPAPPPPPPSRRSERASMKPDFVRLAEGMTADELEQRISESLTTAAPAPPPTATAPNRPPPKPKSPRPKAKAVTANGNGTLPHAVAAVAPGPSTSGKERIAPLRKSAAPTSKGTKKGLSSSEDSFDSQSSPSESESGSDAESGGRRRSRKQQHRSRRSHAEQVAASIVPGSRYFEFNPYANARFRSSRFKPRDRSQGGSKRDSMDSCDSDDAAELANALARPMSHDEKRQLSSMISRLPENGLLGVIHIIRTCEPSMRDKFKQENEDEAEIDFEVLQARTLRELEAFARNALYNVRVPKSFPVAASLAQQPKRSSLSDLVKAKSALAASVPTPTAAPPSNGAVKQSKKAPERVSNATVTVPDAAATVARSQVTTTAAVRTARLSDSSEDEAAPKKPAARKTHSSRSSATSSDDSDDSISE